MGMKIKRITLNSSQWRRGWRRRRKKTVTSCKNLRDLDLHISLSLSLSKRRLETKLRDGLISWQSKSHIFSLRYASLTNFKRYIPSASPLWFTSDIFLNFDSNHIFLTKTGIYLLTTTKISFTSGIQLHRIQIASGKESHLSVALRSLHLSVSL